MTQPRITDPFITEPAGKLNGKPKREPRRPRPQSVLSEDGIPTVLLDEGRTEWSNARRLVAIHGDDVRYCGPWGKWLAWDGKRWAADDLAVEARAKDVARYAWRQLDVFGGEAGDGLKAAFAFCRATASANGQRNLLRLAQSEPRIPIMPEVLDKDPWLLNCDNKTLDLRTGELRPHRREDYLTKRCPVAFDPQADCPRLLEFLREITAGDNELQRYLQKAVGFSLTGDVSEHVLFFLYGIGANGKSTFVNAIQTMMGPDYAMKAPPDLLLVKSGETHPTERADLAGKRFVACIEAGEGKRLAEALVKEMSGGDKVRARRMREDIWEFNPTHKIWLAANHKPVIRGTDYGIWRRIKLIPFTVTIPPERQDRELPLRLAEEMPGLLNWALQGCIDWQAEGLTEPEAVTAATQQYREQQDVLAGFLAECCYLERGARARGGDLLAAYRKWAGDDRMSQRRLAEMLIERGYSETAVIGGYTFRLGIGLLDDTGPSGDTA